MQLEQAPRTWLDIWALCRRDHGMTWPEFQGLTLAQLEALEERRATQIRHARYDAALIVSAICNANRAPDSEAISPFDFLAGFEPDPEQAEKDRERREVVKAVRYAMMDVKGGTPEQVQEEKRQMIDRMNGRGLDGADIFREAYPDL